MTDISDLHPRISTECLGAPPATMTLKIRDAARMWMRETSSWRADHADVTLAAGTNEYALTPPTDGELVRVLEVDHLAAAATRARPLYPKAEAMFRRGFRSVESSDPRLFLTPKLGIIEVSPVPDVNVTGVLTNIVMQVRPSRLATTIDEDVLNRWEEEIMTGAQWLMYDMQDKPWTNKAEARRYKLRFTKYWKDAERELDKGFVKGDLKVKIPQL